MVQPDQPGINVPSNYWNPNTAAMDVEKKKYRSIPVPAILNPKQKYIDDEVALAELVEFIATSGDFEDFDVRKLQGLPAEGVADQVSVWLDEINAAPEVKRESAQRSFGGHLEDFGAAIGRGLLGGVNKIIGAPGISHTLSALSAPGEEVTAQILYNIARIMPGEQDIERGVTKWREENPDAPWWKRHTLTSAVRAEGFGVPMGLHLPMEIIFDPLNLIPVGAAFKLAKPTKVMLSLMGKGKNSKEAFQLTKRLMRYQNYAKQKAAMLSDEAVESVDILDNTNFETTIDELYVEYPYLQDVASVGAFLPGANPFTGKPRHWIADGAGEGSARPEGGWGAASDEVEEQLRKQTFLKEIDGVLQNPLYARQYLRQYEELLRGRKTELDDTGHEPFGINTVEDDDLRHIPGIRGIPLRGSKESSDGLYAIAHDEAAWANYYEISKAAGIDGERSKWALQLLWHTGIRPNEIEYIKWGDIIDMLNTGDKYLTLSVKEAGAKTTKTSRRLIDDDAQEFFRNYADKIRDPEWKSGKHHDLEGAGFALPRPVKNPDGTMGSSISGLQKHFVEMAGQEQHAAYGRRLLDFYENNKNFSYVFRLSKANDVWVQSKGVAGLQTLMETLGHSSSTHTSRYVSFFQHEFDTNMLTLLEGLAGNKVGIQEALEAATENLNKGAWRSNVESAEELEKLGEIGVFSVINPAAMTRKGFANEVRGRTIVQQELARYEVLKAALSKEVKTNLIYPGTLKAAKTKIAVDEALSGVSQLQDLALQLQEAILEKRFIKNIKEVKDPAKLDPKTKDLLKAIRSKATTDIAQMGEWFRPILKLADEYLLTLVEAEAKVGLRSGFTPEEIIAHRTAYSATVKNFAAGFKFLQVMAINQVEAAAKQGGKGQSLYNKLDSQFGRIFRMAPRFSNDPKKPTGKAAAAQRLEDLTEAELEEIERFREFAQVGYIISPLPSGRHIKASGVKIEGTDIPGNPKYKEGTSRNRWMITGWRKVAKEGQDIGDIFKPGDDIREIEFALIEKLGTEAFQGNKIVLAAVEESFEIHRLDLDAWRLAAPEPFPDWLVRQSSHGGKAALQASEVAERIFSLKNDPSGNGNMKHMRSLLGDAYKADRLRANGHLIPIPGSKNEYRWSDEVLEAFNKPRADGKAGTQSDEWGYAAAGGDEVPPPPRARPGANTDGEMPDGTPPGNKLTWLDDRNILRTLADTIYVPRGMAQIMTYSGEKFAERFSKLPYKMQKFVRMIVPGTFGASEAAKLRWAYIMSKSEGQEVSSNLGHMLDKMHAAFGSNRRNGRGEKITLKHADRTSIDPNTGMFVDERTIMEDYYRLEGDIVGPKDSMFNHKVAKEMGRGNDNQILGPLAVMEQKFIEFSTKYSEKWGIYVVDEGKTFGGNAIINAERRKFNHLAQMQDMTTFLNTSRGDLKKFYNLDTPEGIEQMIWWDKYHQVQPHLIDLLKKAGYDVDNDKSIIGMTSEEMRDSFVPSLFLENDQTLMKGASSLGMKPSQMKARLYHWQIENKMQDGMVHGRINHSLYNTDPILAIQRTAEAYYDWIAMDRFMDEFAKLGFQTAELQRVDHVAEYVLDYVSKKNTSGAYELTSAQQRMAGKFFGPNWRNMTNLEASTRIEKLHSMSAAWRNLNLRESATEAPSTHRLHETALPPDASKELRALIEDVFTPQSPFLSGPSTVANMMRVLATGADLGVMLLHGIGGIGMMFSPNIFMNKQQRFAWAKGTWNMGRGMMDPKIRTQWYESTQLTRRDMQKYGVGFFRSTHIEDLPLPGLFTKGQVRPGLDKPGIRQISTGMTTAWAIPERMMQGFGYFLDVSKTEMWKAQSGALRRHFGTIDNANPSSSNYDNVSPAVREAEEAALNDLAAGMNATHGTLQPASVGIPQKQRVFESAFLMYAALYKRSAVAMITNLMAGLPSSAMKGGPFTEAGRAAAGARKWRRGPALEAVSGMLLSGAAIGWAIKGMGFNDDIFHPDSPDFMSMKIGGMRLGIGTPYYALTRLAKDIIDQMEDDPSGLGELNFSDNPLLRFFRSGSSPVTAIGIDLAMGQTFIGDPLRDTTGGWEVNKIGSRISRNLQPFWLDSLEDSVMPFGSGDMHPSASLAEFFGLRTSPLSPYGKMKATKNTAILLSENPDIVEWREKAQLAGLPVTGDTIPKLLLDKLIQDTPDLQRLEDELSEDIQRRGSYDRKQQDEYIQQVKLNREGTGSPEDDNITGLNKQLAGLDAKFSSGQLSGREFREAVELLEAEHRGKNQQLAYTYREVIQGFEERRTLRLNDPIGNFVLDLWYDLYRAHVTSAQDLHDEYGNFNSEMFKARQEWFKEAVDSRFTDPDTGEPYGWNYIEERRNSKKQLPGSVARLDKARNEQLVDFWNLPDVRFSENHAGIIHSWRSRLTKEGKAYFQRKNPIVTRLLSRLKTYQDRYRRSHPTVDALLVEFYDYAALTPAGRTIERKRQIAAATAPVATPAVFTAPTISPLMESFTTENPVLR
jgi:integrase